MRTAVLFFGEVRGISHLWTRIYEIENNFVYDNVILTRLDINLLGPIRIPTKLPCVYAKILSRTAIFEQVIAGPSSDIDILSSFFEATPELYINYCKVFFLGRTKFSPFYI